MKYIRNIFFIAGMLLSVHLSAQNTGALKKTVNELCQDKELMHATLAVSVRDARTGTELYSYDAYRSLTPASLVKLFTTAAGFDMLGPSFRFTTTIGYAGNIDKNGTLHGNVYIMGGGDPLLGSYRYRQTQPDSLFASWHKALQSAGIKSVNGRICYHTAIFDRQPLPDSWQWGDIGNYYGAGAYGLNYHENMFFIYFTPGSRVGYPATIATTNPAQLNVNLQNEVMTAAENSGDQTVVYGEPGSNVRVCRGTIPLGKSNFAVRAAMPNPAEICAEQFATYLRKHKCNVTKSVEETFLIPKEMHTALKYMSNPYYILAQYTNLTSNNTYAECIYKYLGYQRYGLGSYANGAKSVNDFFRQIGLSCDGVKLVDGSGLSRQNRCTADFLSRFLSQVSRMDIYADYVKTLGEAGKNGTVRNMKLNLPAGTAVYMKSGSMEGVRNYAGYVVTDNGKHYTFAILCNNYECSGSQMRTKLEKIIKEIALLS